MLYQIKVFVSIKSDVLDPQGKTVNEALVHLGHNNIKNLRIGKYITFKLSAESLEAMQKQTQEVCEKVLSNPIIESYEYTWTPLEQ